MTNSTKSLKIAFDNAGGAVLFGHNYAHSYSDGKDLAADVICLLAGSDVRTWDGNDDELCRAMRSEDLSGYDAVYTIPEVASMLANGFVAVEGDSVRLIGEGGHRERHGISGYTEARFFRAVSAR